MESGESTDNEVAAIDRRRETPHEIATKIVDSPLLKSLPK